MTRTQALGHAIREARERTGLSQERLAEQAGLHRNSVGLIERGANLTVPTMFALADALGVRASQLVARAEEFSEA